MAQTFRDWQPDQRLLLPIDARDWLPSGHFAYFLVDVVQQLDVTEIERSILFHAEQKGGGVAKSDRGVRPFDPRMMLAVLFYGYSNGIFSSRRLHRATYEDVAMRLICAGQHPHHRTICTFRRTHLQHIESLFLQILAIARKAGMIGAVHWALDGTKVQANASRHKAMSYKRLTAEEQRLSEEISALMAKAEAADTDEDHDLGEDRDGHEVPEDIKRRDSRLARIRQAKAELEAEAAETRRRELAEREAGAREEAAKDDASAADRSRAERAAKKLAEATELAEDKAKAVDGVGLPEQGVAPARRMPEHEVACNAEGEPDPKAQRNFTDAQSRIMKTGQGFTQGYNAQIVVDEQHHLVVATGVGNLSPDSTYATPMMTKALEDNALSPTVVTMDAGYWSSTNAEALAQMGLDAYIATGRDKHGVARPEATAAEVAAATDPRRKMSAKTRTAEGRRIYSRRKATVEPVFGRIKEALGFRRFSMRGIAAARAEWSLVCAVHNLLKVFAFRRTLALAAPVGGR